MNSDQQVDWSLLARYVTGACSPDERVAIETWIAGDEERERLVVDLRQVWEGSKRPITRRDVEAAWNNLYPELQREESPAVAGSRRATRPERPPARRNRRGGAILMTTGAILSVVAVTAFFLFKLELLRVPLPEALTSEVKVFTTQKGQRATVQLTDGTTVQLNVDSELIIPGDFAENVREVRLEGEAYFEVAEDAQHPFLVHSGGSIVEVLGTKFGVRSYPAEELVQVAVSEGRVALRPRFDAVRDTVVLNASDVATVYDRRLSSVRRSVDVERYLSWTKGHLFFENASFREVVATLEQWYDLEIEVAMPFDSVRAFDGTFDTEPLSEILNTVAAALNLTYKRTRRHITFDWAPRNQ